MLKPEEGHCYQHHINNIQMLFHVNRDIIFTNFKHETTRIHTCNQIIFRNKVFR